MRSIFESFCNDFKTITSMPSSASVLSGLRKFRFLDISSAQRALQLTQAKFKKYLIGSLQDR
jgi:hypothetical protein